MSIYTISVSKALKPIHDVFCMIMYFSLPRMRLNASCRILQTKIDLCECICLDDVSMSKGIQLFNGVEEEDGKCL